MKRQEADLKSKKEAEDKALEYLMNLKDELDDRRKELEKKEEEVKLKWERFKPKKINYFKHSKRQKFTLYRLSKFSIMIGQFLEPAPASNWPTSSSQLRALACWTWDWPRRPGPPTTMRG